MNPIQDDSVVPQPINTLSKGAWAACTPSMALVPITDPSGRHDAALCEDVNMEVRRWCLSPRFALLQGQVTSNIDGDPRR